MRYHFAEPKNMNYYVDEFLQFIWKNALESLGGQNQLGSILMSSIQGREDAWLGLTLVHFLRDNVMVRKTYRLLVDDKERYFEDDEDDYPNNVQDLSSTGIRVARVAQNRVDQGVDKLMRETFKFRG